MKITEDMVTVFNQILESLNCSFKLKFETGVAKNNQCRIVPLNDIFFHSFTINLTDEFYELLEDFFMKRNIELSYNNDKSIFWSKDGWK